MTNKSSTAFLLIALTSLGLMSSDIHVSAQPFMQDFFKINETKIQSLMSIFFAGTVLSCLIVGMLSDAHGRKPYVLLALAGLILANTILTFSDSFIYFQLARFIQGLSAGTLSVISFAVIQDCSKNPEFSRKYFSYIGIILIFIPAISPLLGGFILEIYGWQYIFYFLLCLSITAFAFSIRFLIETHDQAFSPFTFQSSFKSAKNTLSTPQFLNFVFIYPLLSIGYWIFITDSAFVFKNKFLLSPINYKYLISTTVLMFAAGNILSRTINSFISAETILRTGIIISISGSIILISQQSNDYLAIYLLGNMIFIFGIGLMFSPATFLTLSAVKNNKGMSASIRSGFNMLASWIGATLSQFIPLNKIYMIVLFFALMALILSLKIRNHQST